ncbi:Aldo keto reductase [Micractinium conductrix]|uniref:Aldo keto reductase n=1 Tax=Micractinium conductrix TaxID=554055 RepID=A0A2P6VF27_9CHLO|nr:Aldo keto reductase [Micractinium conductrix]|eukprot:PSC72677.1 Aldo keto reductase [Micractinium conductrix]
MRRCPPTLGAPPSPPPRASLLLAGGLLAALLASAAALTDDQRQAAFIRQYVPRGAAAGEDEPLTLSSLGLGTYLGGDDAATDEAVTAAVIQTVAQHRWNVIDTAANYRWGRAEVAVGRALQSLRALGAAQRDELFISTKAGYPPEGLLARLLEEGTITQDDVAGGSHCMAPAFLNASLHRSLDSLGLATVDLLYIHNPAESQLALLGKAAFMERLRAAFEFCESARAEGRIRAYGIATWSCFRVPPTDEHLSLLELVQLAERVGGSNHGFTYIQLPVSAGMPEAWSQTWQMVERSGSGGVAAERVTLLQAAQQLGLGVFGSGPLLQGKLVARHSLARAVEALPPLQGIEGTGPKLLQLARSTPGLLTTLVGHKAPAHVAANCALTAVPPLARAEWKGAMAALLPPRSSV